MNRLDAAIGELVSVVREIADFGQRTFRQPRIVDGDLQGMPTWESVAAYPEREALRERLNNALGAVLGLGGPVWRGGDLPDRLRAIRDAVTALPGWGVGWGETLQELAAEKRHSGSSITAADVQRLTEQRIEKLLASVRLLDPLRSEAADDGDAKPNNTPAGKGKTVRPKRSTNKGDARTKLIAVLTEHHKYYNGSCGNTEYVGCDELARRAEVSQGSASNFFKAEFKGHDCYKVVCRSPARLAEALKVLNDEFSPFELYGRDPAREG